MFKTQSIAAAAAAFMAASALAQQAGPCQNGQELSASKTTGVQRCVGKPTLSAFEKWSRMPASSYAEYAAKMAAAKADPTSAWLVGGAQPLTEKEWNAQKERADSDAARGIVFGGGANTAAQGYSATPQAASDASANANVFLPAASGAAGIPLNPSTGQPASAVDIASGHFSNRGAPSDYHLWAQMPAGTYKQYLDKMNAGKASTDPLTQRGLPDKPLTEAQWNAQQARVASDAARGIAFGGGAPARDPGRPASQLFSKDKFIAKANANANSYGAGDPINPSTGQAASQADIASGNFSNRGEPSAYNSWSDMPTGTYQQYVDKMQSGMASSDPLTHWLLGGSQPMSESDWNAQQGRAASEAQRGITFGGGSR